MKQSFIILIAIALFICTLLGQKDPYGLEKTKEEIVKLSINASDNFYPVGYYNNNVVFKSTNDERQSSFYILNEDNYTFSQLFYNTKINNTLEVKNKDSLIFFTQSSYDYEYSFQYIYNGNNKFLLDSIYNSEKDITANFTDNNLLIVSTLSFLAYMYNPKDDDKLTIYDLKNISKGEIEKTEIPCKYCSNGNIVNGSFFFEISNERDDFDNGYEWKDIYTSTLENFTDTILIAKFSSILAITPDGKYILAERKFDLPNGPRAIIDVENKKYQLLLGRAYRDFTPFYSFKKKKFGFYKKDIIIYVDFPQEYPYDALKRENDDIPSWRNIEYFDKFKHTPLE